MKVYDWYRALRSPQRHHEHKIISFDIWWGDGCANSPDFNMVIDSMPEFSTHDIHTIKGEREKLYISIVDGLAHYFVWAGTPDRGFAGWKRDVQVRTGGRISTITVIGGWASNPTMLDAAGLGRWADASVNGRSLAITVERLEEALAEFHPDVELTETKHGIITAKWRGEIDKDEHLRREEERTQPIRERLKEKYAGERPWEWWDRITDDERAELETVPYSSLGGREPQGQFRPRMISAR